MFKPLQNIYPVVKPRAEWVFEPSFVSTAITIHNHNVSNTVVQEPKRLSSAGPKMQ